MDLGHVIEKSIEIDADAAQVWPLVSEPGWWINDGEYVEHVVERRADGVVTVTDPVHGVFPLVVVEEREPRYVAFRWLARTDEPAVDGPGTLTEFWVEDRPGGVTLRVRESGFESLDESEAELLKTVADNTEGWDTELAVAKRHLEGRHAA
ncbi:ATPase [Phycicoccus sonneratiae]|uniref:ATPase n=1 Tax=Phycicoccus sonneratiae TaxID=2807628 RepID=A0ABS2CPM4_9MICO|nr:ATPase [Phycicoccus sonneraticus]MBM6401842.1 ATPase [Phycicoccus sonneraticus]